MNAKGWPAARRWWPRKIKVTCTLPEGDLVNPTRDRWPWVTCPWCGCETRLQRGRWAGHRKVCPMRPEDGAP